MIEFELSDIFIDFRKDINNTSVIVPIDFIKDEPITSWYTLILMPILMVVGAVGNTLVRK